MASFDAFVFVVMECTAKLYGTGVKDCKLKQYIILYCLLHNLISPSLPAVANPPWLVEAIAYTGVSCAVIDEKTLWFLHMYTCPVTVPVR